MNLRLTPRRHDQRGAVLVVGLIMLLLITLIAVAAIRLSTTHVQVVGNERFKTEAATATNYALDLVLNNRDFDEATLSSNPVVISVEDAASTPSGTVLTAKYTDPVCSRARILKNSELSKTVSGSSGATVDVFKSKLDQACTLTPDQSIQVFGPSSSGTNSLCADTLWDVSATVDDPNTGASVTMTQGIEMRIVATEKDTKCKP